MAVIALVPAAPSIMSEPAHPKICFPCARARLAKRAARPCADCALLNLDPLAQIRARAAKPSPLHRLHFVVATNRAVQCSIYQDGQTPARSTSWERGE